MHNAILRRKGDAWLRPTVSECHRLVVPMVLSGQAWTERYCWCLGKKGRGGREERGSRAWDIVEMFSISQK